MFHEALQGKAIARRIAKRDKLVQKQGRQDRKEPQKKSPANGSGAFFYAAEAIQPVDEPKPQAHGGGVNEQYQYEFDG
jgi:hypothetical protein